MFHNMSYDIPHDMCYKAIKAQDARCDGVFFTAVKTTGIYCRPICRVPIAKYENCTFYKSAAEAEKNGYRPCLRCRPELAPAYKEFKQNSELIRMIKVYFETCNYKPGSISKSAEYFGIRPRQLTKIFQDTLGVSPQSYLMTKRLLTSKVLLTDTRLSLTEIALISGFGSVSSFNASFKKHYLLTPTDLRKKRSKKNSTDDSIKVKLSYRPPYNWTAMLDFYKMRTIPGVEWITDSGIYRRSIQLENEGVEYSGWIEVKPDSDNNLVLATISKTLEKVLMLVIEKIKLAFDLDAATNLLPKDLPSGLRLPGCFDAFEMGTRAILGQQITVKAAHTLAKRMVDLLGKPVSSPWKEINHHFPTAKAIKNISKPMTEVLGPLGVIRNKSKAISALATSIALGEIQLVAGFSPDDQRKKLLALKGIGPWTAEYLIMRCMSWPDAFPVWDIGLKHALGPLLLDEDGSLVMDNKKGCSNYKLNKAYEASALKYAEKFRPWRSYLTIALWHSLSDEK